MMIIFFFVDGSNAIVDNDNNRDGDNCNKDDDNDDASLVSSTNIYQALKILISQ